MRNAYIDTRMLLCAMSDSVLHQPLDSSHSLPWLVGLRAVSPDTHMHACMRV